MALTHGPALGFNAVADPTNGKVTVFVRGNANETYEVEYSENSDLSGSTTTSSGKFITIATDDGTQFIDITGLTPGTRYYYTPVLGGSRAIASSFPSFRALPASPSGLKIVWGSCMENNNPGSYLGVDFNLLDYALNTIDPHLWVMMGDFIYAEDNTTAWDSASSASDPPIAHYHEHYRETMAYTNVQNMLRNVPMIWNSSDHEIMSSWPDANFSAGLYSHSGVDDPVNAAAYAGGTGFGKAAMQDYVEKFAKAPVQSGEAGSPGLYGRFVWGDYELIFLDTRHERRRVGGTIIGLTQRAWLINRLLNTTAKYVLVFTPETFAGLDATNYDDWESKTLAGIENYQNERGLIDSVARRSPATVYFFGADHHAGCACITNGGNYAFSASPFGVRSGLQRTIGTPLDEAMQQSLYASTVNDLRMGVVTLNGSGVDVDIYRNNTDNNPTAEYSIAGI